MNPPASNGNNSKTNTKNGFNPRGRRGNWYKRGGGNRRLDNIPAIDPNTNNNVKSQKDLGPFKGWKLYFNNEAFVPDSITHKKVQAMMNYIQRNPEIFSINLLLETRSGNVDTKLLKSDIQFLTEWSSFLEDLFDNPEHTISCMGCAVYQIIYDEIRKDTQQTLLEVTDVDIITPPPVIQLRPINYEPITQFKNLKVHLYGKLITIRGTVIRCGPSKLLCKWLAWKCDSCLQVHDVYQEDGVLTAPSSCPTKGCRSRKFHQMLADPLTRTTDWQVIKLQETVANHQIEGGVPRTIELELSEDLVGLCIPGDDVTVTGVLKVQNNNNGTKGNNSAAANMFLLYIEAVSLVKDKNQTSAVAGKHSIAGIEFAVKDYYAIQKIQAEEALVRLLVHSLCPTIFGQEIVKLGLLLGLFGSGSGVRTESRMDSHILLVGDPGLGKSQLLQACANVAPRGVYVCGNTSTSAGLTVSLSRESGGDFALEAGALVLADQGICCIDEFDKMSTQHQALLEAMEQQTISIAKGGVVCTLSARCGVLAAANPHGGHYNKGKTVAENLRLGSALLSRFDLVFILLDKPDQHLDTLLSEHVLALHNSMKKRNDSSGGSSTPSMSSASINSRYDPDEPLKERLRVHHGETLDLIPLSLLRKYIAYARKYVHTKLSAAAADVLQRFYMELRKQHQTNDSTPVTARQLQAMVRLTQARARLELRELATERDALDIIEVMRHSLVDTFSDNFGNLNFTRSQNGSGISSKSQAKKFLTLLTKYTEQKQKSLIDIMEIKRVAESGNIPICEVNHLISSLNLQGFLIKKGNQRYQLLLSQY